jgi:hypothetical protein
MVCWSAGQSGLHLAGRWGHGWAVLRVRSLAESTGQMTAVLKAGLTAACWAYLSAGRREKWTAASWAAHLVEQ